MEEPCDTPEKSRQRSYQALKKRCGLAFDFDDNDHQTFHRLLSSLINEGESLFLDPDFDFLSTLIQVTMLLSDEPAPKEQQLTDLDYLRTWLTHGPIYLEKAVKKIEQAAKTRPTLALSPPKKPLVNLHHSMPIMPQDTRRGRNTLSPVGSPRRQSNTMRPQSVPTYPLWDSSPRSRSGSSSTDPSPRSLQHSKSMFFTQPAPGTTHANLSQGVAKEHHQKLPDIDRINDHDSSVQKSPGPLQAIKKE